MADRALLLVRNAVTHDARVLRAAAVLRDEGHDVLVAGVAAGAAPVGRAEVAGTDVVRLAA
ncbi:MAG: hypothetical protein JWN32_1177, partial [Solirubrobacterales bacterium]|nr:hypothetical protein [Solirubrobacterales bacterium]